MKCCTHLGFAICILFGLCLITLNNGVDVAPQKENYVPDYKLYHNLSLLSTHLKSLEKQYPNYIRLSHEYISRNGESQLFTKVSNYSSRSGKGVKPINIFFAYGEHAREFFPVESLIYFLKNLTSGIDCNSNSMKRCVHAYKFSRWILSNFEIYIVAMTNPDGRKFIEKTKNYCWRGTASGVDLNRNFDWSFGQKGSSANPKDDEYRGSHAFSEPETVIFQQITKNALIDAYVSFHSGIRHIYVPFADSLSKRAHRVPYNKDHMINLAEKLSKSSPLRPFKYGIASDLTGYFADGTSFDYMSGVKKVPFSFAIELWQHKHHQGRSCFDEFNPHSNNLQKELAMVHPLYVELLSYLYQWKHSGKKGKDRQLQKPLSRSKKDEGHQRFPRRNDVMFTSENANAEEENSLHSHLQLMVILILVLVIIYFAYRHLFNLMRKKRIVSLRSLSSSFSMLKNM